MQYLSTCLIPLIVFLSINRAEAQIYVNQNASGNDDGSSWNDAYLDLQDALNNSNPDDQVWVASGIYKPGGDTANVNSFFSFPHDLQIYGGFVGNETILSERDITNNETVLSGDHNANDLEDDFTSFRSDNSRHVIWLTDTITTATVIDGFTVRNGNTAPESGEGDERRGGGILAYGTPIIRNCTFTQNFGYFGGAVYPREGTASFVIDNCLFERNQGRSGAAIYITAENGTIQNCTFNNNVATSTGGGIHINTAENEILISECYFEGNIAQTFRGGGIYTASSSGTIMNCEFISNEAPGGAGGGVHVQSFEGDPIIEVNIMDCIFDNNKAAFAGAVGSYNLQTITNISNCSFKDCVASSAGGAISNAGDVVTNITACDFESNSSNFGGAIYNQGDLLSVSISRSNFLANVATSAGGALAAITSNEVGPELPQVTIDKSSFRLNSAANVGGAIDMLNTDANIINCEFGNNNTTLSGNTAYGGALSFDASDNLDIPVSIMNSSIINNFSDNGAGITLRTTVNSSLELTIQNTILYNPGGQNYELLEGNTVINSNGGNLSSDDTFMDAFTSTNDLNNTDPLLMDYLSGDYRLTDESPAVNTGIETNAPTTDIEGNMRVNQIDMGAYENQNLVNTRDLETSIKSLSIFPNPVVNELQFQLENTWRGELNVTITNMQGAIISSQSINKQDQMLNTTYNITHLPSGIYQLNVSNAQAMVSRSFIK